MSHRQSSIFIGSLIGLVCVAIVLAFADTVVTEIARVL